MPAIEITSGQQEGLFLPLGKRAAVVGRDEGLLLQIDDERFVQPRPDSV